MELKTYIENIESEIDSLETMIWILRGKHDKETDTIREIIHLYESSINEISYSMNRIKEEYGSEIPNKSIQD